jgi:hypothetical protein
MAAVLLALGQGSGSAQSWPPPNPYIQPAPYPQPSYAQSYAPPAYSQPSPYGAQQPYAQQPSYPQQPYAPSYGPPNAPPNAPSGQPYPQDDSAQFQPPAAAPAEALGAEQLEQLVAPIALYPDSLVGQVLAAATYPAQVSAADHWRQALGYASPDQIVAGADAQPWDPSVKALTAFPQVLAQMDVNLQWTTELGNAYYNQPQDVLGTIQVMRQRAQAAGNLQNTAQESVSYDQGYIELAPPNPQVAYVPSYNPWDVYGQPVTPYSGFSLLGALGSIGSFAGSSLLHYGPGIAMGAFSHTPWGALAWGLDWLANSVLFNHSNYSSRSTSVAHWNLPVRTPHGFAERAGIGRPGEPYNRIPRGNNWAGGGYAAPRQQTVTRQPDRYAENRPYEAPRQNYAAPDRNGVRPAFDNYRSEQPPANRPQPYASRPQQAYNRAPEPMRQNSGQGYGSGFMSRPSEGYGSRSGQGYGSPMPEYRAQATVPQRNFGERYSEPSMGRGLGGQQFRPEQFKSEQFKQEKSGGFHPFGGGHNSDSFSGGGKMPKNFGHEKMPKNFGHEKMPKAPHSSGHSGGGHFFGGHHR